MHNISIEEYKENILHTVDNCFKNSIFGYCKDSTINEDGWFETTYLYSLYTDIIIPIYPYVHVDVFYCNNTLVAVGYMGFKTPCNKERWEKSGVRQTLLFDIEEDIFNSNAIDFKYVGLYDTERRQVVNFTDNEEYVINQFIADFEKNIIGSYSSLIRSYYDIPFQNKQQKIINAERIQSYVDRAIFIRGRAMKIAGKIKSVNNNNANEYSCIIENSQGTGYYNSGVKINSGELTGFYCNCPYGSSNFTPCKHVIALLLYLSEL